MKKQLSAMALVMAMTLASTAYADNDFSGKASMEGGAYKAALAKLPEKDAAQFRDTLKQAHEKNKAYGDQLDQLHKDLKTILTAPKFDKDAYIAKTTQLQQLHDKMHANTSAAFASAASQLSQDERKSLSEAFDERRSHWQHHGDKDADNKTKAGIDTSK